MLRKTGTSRGRPLGRRAAVAPAAELFGEGPAVWRGRRARANPRRPALRRRPAADRPLHQRPQFGRQVDLQRGGAAPVGHLAPGLAQDVRQLPLVVLRSEVGEVVLQEDEADHVLQELHVGVGLQPLLAEQRLHAGHGGAVVPDLAEDRPRRLRVEAAEVGPPPAVAVPTGRVAVARDRPAPDVLAARGETDRLRRAGGESVERRSHPPRVHHLARQRLPVDRLAARVLRVGAVEAGERGSDAILRNGCLIHGHPSGGREPRAGPPGVRHDIRARSPPALRPRLAPASAAARLRRRPRRRSSRPSPGAG